MISDSREFSFTFRFRERKWCIQFNVVQLFSTNAIWSLVPHEIYDIEYNITSLKFYVDMLNRTPSKTKWIQILILIPETERANVMRYKGHIEFFDKIDEYGNLKFLPLLALGLIMSNRTESGSARFIRICLGHQRWYRIRSVVSGSHDESLGFFTERLLSLHW